MPTRVVLNDRAVQQAAQPATLEVGEDIARSTARRAKDHEYIDSLTVVPIPLGARVLSDYWGAHFDEFGTVNNPPTAAMRSSAAEAGRYEPEAKP